MTKKISELPAVTTPDDTDAFEINQAGTSKKATRAQVLRPPSNDTLDAFNQYRDAPSQFTNDFTFSEATSGRALIQINPNANTVKMTLPDATGLTGQDGWLCDVRVASGAFASSVEVAVTGQMSIQNGYSSGTFDPEADEQFFGLDQPTALNNVYSLYKRGGVYQWQAGFFRNAAVDDLTFDGPLHGGIATPTDIDGRTLSDSDHNKQFRCTGTSNVVIPSSLTDGFICLLINRAGGAVTIAGSGLTPDGDLSLGDDHFATISKDAATSALVRTTG